MKRVIYLFLSMSSFVTGLVLLMSHMNDSANTLGWYGAVETIAMVMLNLFVSAFFLVKFLELDK